MSATAALGVGVDRAAGDAFFERRVRDLESSHLDLWHSTESGPPTLGDPVPRRRQWENGREAERLLEDVARRCEAFYDTTMEFVREARCFDPRLQMEDVMQALRNVWIMNSVQLLLGRGIGFSPAVFAYSMLYPCTDNFLDDPRVSPDAKAGFNRRLGRRLRGEKDLILRNGTFLLVGSIARCRDPLSDGFLGAIEERWSFLALL